MFENRNTLCNTALKQEIGGSNTGKEEDDANGFDLFMRYLNYKTYSMTYPRMFQLRAISATFAFRAHLRWQVLTAY